MVAIIDYGLGNLASVQKSLNFLGIKNLITHDKVQIKNSSSILLPGVGSFFQGMKNLKERNLVNILTEEVIVRKKKFLGICLGMQLIFERGDEPFPTKGLGWIKGEVKKIEPKGLIIPHLGWNNITYNLEKGFKDSLENNFYFIHSYHAKPKDFSCVNSYFDYGGPLVGSIKKDNIFATQFHPEKSQNSGLILLKKYFKGNA